MLTAEQTNLQPRTMWLSKIVKSPRASGCFDCSFSTKRVMVIKSVRWASALWSIFHSSLTLQLITSTEYIHMKYYMYDLFHRLLYIMSFWFEYREREGDDIICEERKLGVTRGRRRERVSLTWWRRITIFVVMHDTTRHHHANFRYVQRFILYYMIICGCTFSSFFFFNHLLCSFQQPF